METFNVGDRVTWTSQSSGCWKTKIGTIVAVVPAGSSPTTIIGIRKWSLHHNPARTYSFGLPRKHESYLVHVDGKGTLTYWPLVKYLKKLEEHTV